MGFSGGGATTVTEVPNLVYQSQLSGEPLTKYDVVFQDGGFWKKANSRTAPRNALPMGIAQATVASGISLSIWAQALLSNGAWSLTSGAKVFLASGDALSGGVLASVPPSASGDTVIILGWAMGVSAIEFRPVNPIITGQ